MQNQLVRSRVPVHHALMARAMPDSPGAALCLSNNFFCYFSNFGELVTKPTNLRQTHSCFAQAVFYQKQKAKECFAWLW